MPTKPLAAGFTNPPLAHWVHTPYRNGSDLTEAMRHESEDAHELCLLRQIMASSQDCIKTLDLESRLLWMNEAGQRILEIDDFELVKHQPWIDSWQPAERPAALAAFELAKNNGIGKFTGFCPTAKGTPRWWEVVLSPMRNTQGWPEQILCVSRTITEEAVFNTGALQSAMFNSVNFSCIATDENGLIQIFNVGAERMLGYTAAEVVGKITPAILHDAQEVMLRAATFSREFHTPITADFAALAFKAARGMEDIYELTKVRKDGSRFPALVSVTALRDAQNLIIGYLLIGTDNTARRQVEENQRGVEEIFRQVAINMPEALWVSDANSGTLLYINPVWEKLTGWPLKAGDGIDQVIQAIHPDDALRIRHEANKFAPKSINITRAGDAAQRIRHQTSRFASGIDQDCRLIRPDGSTRWVHIRSFPITDSVGQLCQVAGIMEDITDRKIAEQRLLELAHFDPLTGLPNRRHYSESLQRALQLAHAQALSVSVLFIDLDRFKEVNDTLGHALGDQLLRQASQRMLECVRARDIIGRFGGDEFAAILLNASALHATATVADKLIDQLHRPFDLDGHSVTVSASIGIAVSPADSLDAAMLMKYADTAMYEAKSAGRDRYRFYTSAMNTRAKLKQELENALQRALEQEEFVLHYQPVLDIDSGRWIGAEALLRWRRPGHGLISPADFIPALEESGLIVPVGAWVIDTVCLQIADWERSGVGVIAVAVNVSARQFLLAEKRQFDRRELHADEINDGGSSFTLMDFTRAAASALAKHHATPGLLEVELTETTLMTDVEKTIGILSQLKTLGIRIAIDDFGTGYSSLAYLRRFPIDTLKIDRAFIRDVTHNSEDAAITLAIISMAHSLKLKVIAEGVESTEQLEFLRRHGCDQAQGYLLARPMPANELATLFRATRSQAANQ